MFGGPTGETGKEAPMKNVKHAQCTRCGRTVPAVPDLTACPCGGIFDIIYDYEYIKTALSRDALKSEAKRS